MRLRECERMAELRGELATGHWPAAASDELRAHVAECRACAAEATLTEAFRAEKVDAALEAAPVPAGLLWWKAQARRRSRALARTGRTLWAGQVFGFAVVLAAMALLAVRVGLGVAEMQGWGVGWITAGALLLVLGGVAVYLVTA